MTWHRNFAFPFFSFSFATSAITQRPKCGGVVLGNKEEGLGKKQIYGLSNLLAVSNRPEPITPPATQSEEKFCYGCYSVGATDIPRVLVGQ